ncbi:Snf7 family [Dillenia turbinata]|uniref:Snf7 family n=1 Tax=Dillenia turbinata TaxID=194707 RepID=A0AAN8ZGY6_9MAGN
MLYNQTFNLDQVAFASEGIKDAQQTMSALKSANKELKGMMKSVKIQDIDNMQDEMMDLMDVSNEIQESLGRSYSVPDDIDEEELVGESNILVAMQMRVVVVFIWCSEKINVWDSVFLWCFNPCNAELDALEADMGLETESDGVPSYLQPDKEPDLNAELNLPVAPSGHAAVPAGRSNTQAQDELGLPAVPRASIRD